MLTDTGTTGQDGGFTTISISTIATFTQASYVYKMTTKGGVYKCRSFEFSVVDEGSCSSKFAAGLY